MVKGHTLLRIIGVTQKSYNLININECIYKLCDWKNIWNTENGKVSQSLGFKNPVKIARV